MSITNTETTSPAPVEKKRLLAFTVVYHSDSHEMTATVIAYDRWEASKAVSGQVMHVGLGSALYRGEILSESGWNKSHPVTFSKPSDSWCQYLKKRNLNLGLEDV